MNSVKLSIKYIFHKKLSSFLCFALLLVGVATLTTATLIYKNIENNISGNSRNIDMVLGAKGSALQIILSTIYHLDIPTGNISWAEAQRIMKSPRIKTATPISLGDSFKGYRIIGTRNSFLDIYGAKLSSGALPSHMFDAVIGKSVAADTGLKVGDKFIGSHGLMPSDDLHTNFPYTVTGIIEPTSTVLDRLVVSTMESVWEIHSHPDEDEKEEAPKEKETTALLVTFRSPLDVINFPRTINKNTNMQAASPAFETTRLISILGIGFGTIKFFGCITVASSFLIIFMVMLNSVSERKYDIAIMRAMGAGRGKIFTIIITEVLLISLSGLIAGLALGHIFAGFAGALSRDLNGVGISGGKFFVEELYFSISIILFSIMAALLPAIKGYRSDVSKILSGSGA